jgi:hypothetical protein
MKAEGRRCRFEVEDAATMLNTFRYYYYSIFALRFQYPIEPTNCIASSRSLDRWATRTAIVVKVKPPWERAASAVGYSEQ